MDKSVLVNASRKIKKNRPALPVEQICQVFHTIDLLEIGFLSKQCCKDAAGSCMMCDYGFTRSTHTNDMYIKEMRKILSEFKNGFNRLLLCTNGSFMDEYQIPEDLFCLILSEVNNHDIPEIEIETHYSNVTKKKLQLIRQLLKGKKVIIELGLETINPVYQEYIIMKHIDLTEFDKTISMIKNFGFEVEVNIMLGIPFLSEKNQLKDTLETIKWVLDRNCRAIVFPMNIKPFTLLSHMYEANHYTQISHWLVILLLDSIPAEYLNHITLAWYENREEKYEHTEKRTVFPLSCLSCHDLLMIFYTEFIQAESAGKKKN